MRKAVFFLCSSFLHVWSCVLFSDDSYEYSLIAGPFFAVMYAVAGIGFAFVGELGVRVC